MKLNAVGMGIAPGRLSFDATASPVGHPVTAHTVGFCDYCPHVLGHISRHMPSRAGVV